MPCVSELCVGDDLVDVLDLPWQQGAPARAAAPSASGPFAGEDDVVRTVTAYWPQRLFDSIGLQALAEVDAVCRDLGVWRRPKARFVSADGWLTTVSFEPVASGAEHRLRFQVATILQSPPKGATAAEIEAFAGVVAERYAGVPRFPSPTKPGVRWRSASGNGPSLTLFAPIGDIARRRAEFGRDPLCADALEDAAADPGANAAATADARRSFDEEALR